MFGKLYFKERIKMQKDNKGEWTVRIQRSEAANIIIKC